MTSSELLPEKIWVYDGMYDDHTWIPHHPGYSSAGGGTLYVRSDLLPAPIASGDASTHPKPSAGDRERDKEQLDLLIKAGDAAFEGEVAVDGWNTDNLIVEARHEKRRFLQFASFNYPGAQPDPRGNAHFVSVCFNQRDLFKRLRAALETPEERDPKEILAEYEVVDLDLIEDEIFKELKTMKYDENVPEGSFRTLQHCLETRQYNKGRNMGTFAGTRYALKFIATHYTLRKKGDA